MSNTSLFPSMDRVNEILSEIIDEIPTAFFDDLHGGILLDPLKKLHKDSETHRPLYVMGEYARNVLGNQIKIYYGSFECVYPNIKETVLRDLLKKTLLHEFTHHLEYKAGLKGLEVKDAEQLKQYRSKNK